MSQANTNNTPSENAASRKDDNVSQRKAKLTSSASVRNNPKSKKPRSGSFHQQDNKCNAEPSTSRLSIDDLPKKESQGGTKRGAAAAVNNSATVSNWSESIMTKKEEATVIG